MEYAIERAQLRDMVAELKDGLDTEIGEGGIRLSGGKGNGSGSPELFIESLKFWFWTRQLLHWTTKRSRL